MAGAKKEKGTGYDKYVDWKIFCVPVILDSVAVPQSMDAMPTISYIQPKTLEILFDQLLHRLLGHGTTLPKQQVVVLSGWLALQR